MPARCLPFPALTSSFPILMGKTFCRALLFSAVTAATLPLAALASDKDTLPGLINQRLSYMKDVAGSKAVNHQPVEVLSQEDKVLVATQQTAEKLGLDPLSVKPFIMAQMSAAKAIQYRYRADWLASPETAWQPRPLDEVRKNIASLSDQILQRLALELKANGKISPDNQAEFIEDLQQDNLTRADKIQLYHALGQVHLKAQK